MPNPYLQDFLLGCAIVLSVLGAILLVVGLAGVYGSWEEVDVLITHKYTSNFVGREMTETNVYADVKFEDVYDPANVNVDDVLHMEYLDGKNRWTLYEKPKGRDALKKENTGIVIAGGVILFLGLVCAVVWLRMRANDPTTAAATNNDSVASSVPSSVADSRF